MPSTRHIWQKYRAMNNCYPRQLKNKFTIAIGWWGKDEEEGKKPAEKCSLFRKTSSMNVCWMCFILLSATSAPASESKSVKLWKFPDNKIYMRNLVDFVEAENKACRSSDDIMRFHEKLFLHCMHQLQWVFIYRHKSAILKLSSQWRRWLDEEL